MLNILVCVKQIPDVDLVKMDPETGNLIRTGVPTLTNPLDLNALEAAVQVKERYGGQITLITMGPPMAESTLRECLAVGGDRAVLVTGRPFGGADTLSTSYSILMAAEMEGQVSGEHSIGHAKMVYLRESVGEDVFGLMGEIKKVFDPDCILNPGKVCDADFRA